MTRSQFTFYRSYFDALGHLRKNADRLRAYDMICTYALDGTLPDLDALPDSVAVAFALIRPTLDAAARKAQGGMKKPNAGKEPGLTPAGPEKDPGKITVRLREDTGNKKEKENEIEKEYETEDEDETEAEGEALACLGGKSSGSSSGKEEGDDSGLRQVMNAYAGRINPQMSQVCKDQLKAYVRDLGAEVCLRAIDLAVDENKPQWSYLQGILRNLAARGVTSLAAWQEQEAKREAQKARTRRQPTGQEAPEKAVSGAQSGVKPGHCAGEGELSPLELEAITSLQARMRQSGT